MHLSSESRIATFASNEKRMRNWIPFKRRRKSDVKYLNFDEHGVKITTFVPHPTWSLGSAMQSDKPSFFAIG
ncbi:Hypothetical predicted protein, partial [Pelobates cultripes]